jgi:hypothetical protein
MKHSIIRLIVTLTLSILAMALAATAQPVGKVPRDGWLNAGVPLAGPHPWLDLFRQGLCDLGYVEGRNMSVESGSADGKLDRLPDLAAELIRPQGRWARAGATQGAAETSENQEPGPMTAGDAKKRQASACQIACSMYCLSMFLMYT